MEIWLVNLFYQGRNFMLSKFLCLAALWVKPKYSLSAMQISIYLRSLLLSLVPAWLILLNDQKALWEGKNGPCIFEPFSFPQCLWEIQQELLFIRSDFTWKQIKRSEVPLPFQKQSIQACLVHIYSKPKRHTFESQTLYSLVEITRTKGRQNPSIYSNLPQCW